MSVYEVTVEDAFPARHGIRGPGGALEDSHEHEWQVAATYRGEQLDEDGFVVEFLALRGALVEVAASMAGADLNVLLKCPNTGASAERVARHVAELVEDKLKRRPYCVRVVEGMGCSAAFYPDG